MDEITPSKIFIPPNVELLKEDMQKLKANNLVDVIYEQGVLKVYSLYMSK